MLFLEPFGFLSILYESGMPMFSVCYLAMEIAKLGYYPSHFKNKNSVYILPQWDVVSVS